MNLLPLVLAGLLGAGQDIVLVVPAKTAGHEESGIARQTADLVTGLLGDLSLKADRLDESALRDQALAGRTLAILAYNPGLSNPGAAVLEKFAAGGGKVFVCYALPPRLGRTLGFGSGRHVRQDRPGHFAEIRFDAAEIPGLPGAVRQASWNLNTVTPAGHNARVIGRWYDDHGASTGQPALLVSDRGAFLTHILLSDDRPGKRQMLAALVGHFVPTLWPRMAQAAIDRVGHVGHCRSLDELTAFCGASVSPAAAALSSAREAMEKGRYPEAIELAHKARELYAAAYLRTQPSPSPEGRAVWNHSGTGAYPGDWERSAKLLAENGFNIILPNMLWGGEAHYASDLLPRSETFRKYGDQIEQCCAAARRHGLEVHVWKVNFNLSTAPKEFVARLRAEGRTQVTVGGKPQDWLCPSHPENQRLERESMLEVARKYPVAGLHFDYIRYPNRDCCYCDGCRKRFEAASGRAVAQWPKDCYDGPRRGEYNDWRCRQITTLVTAVHDEAKRLRPELKISAAVFGGYPDCRRSVAQDWPEWIKAGLLDFVCPMDYTESDTYFTALVSEQMKLVAGRIPIYPGIGATASHSGLTADRVAGQIHLARSLGAAGFTIFNFDAATAGTIIPGVGQGAGVKRAAIPSPSPSGKGPG